MSERMLNRGARDAEGCPERAPGTPRARPEHADAEALRGDQAPQ